MQVIIPDNEEHYGQLYRMLTKIEGHEARTPSNEGISQTATAQDNWRNKVMEYFRENPDPIYRVELSNILKIEADALRRVCRSLVVAGHLAARRTQTGVVYRSPQTEH
jgi:hypothetical protein